MLAELHLGPIRGLAQAVPIACKLLIDEMLELGYDRIRLIEVRPALGDDCRIRSNSHLGLGSRKSVLASHSTSHLSMPSPSRPPDNRLGGLPLSGRSIDAILVHDHAEATISGLPRCGLLCAGLVRNGPR